MDLVQKRSMRKRSATRRYINESENYQAPQRIQQRCTIRWVGSANKFGRQDDDSDDEQPEEIEESNEEDSEEENGEEVQEANEEEIEEANESEEETNEAPEIRRSSRCAEKLKNNAEEQANQVKKPGYAVLPAYEQVVDDKYLDRDNKYLSTEYQHQTQKNVEAFLRSCSHLNEETALLFLKDNDLKTSIELGKQVQLPNQVPAWLDDMLLNDPTCLRCTTHYSQRRNGEPRRVLTADKLTNVVSQRVLVDAALKAKGHRPIDYVQLLVDVAPKEYTPESSNSDKKKYKEPTRKSGGGTSSTSQIADANKGGNNASRKSDNGNGPDPAAENPNPRSYSLRPKAPTEEVFNDSTIPTRKYKPYTHLATDGSGTSKTAYRAIVAGSTIKFPPENNGSQPSTSRARRRTKRRSRPSHKARSVTLTQEDEDDEDEDEDEDDEDEDEGEDDDDDDYEYDGGKSSNARPSCSQGKKK